MRDHTPLLVLLILAFTALGYVLLNRAIVLLLHYSVSLVIFIFFLGLAILSFIVYKVITANKKDHKTRPLNSTAKDTKTNTNQPVDLYSICSQEYDTRDVKKAKELVDQYNKLLGHDNNMKFVVEVEHSNGETKAVIKVINYGKPNPNISRELTSKIKAKSKTTNKTVNRSSAYSNNSEKNTVKKGVTEYSNSSNFSADDKKVNVKKPNRKTKAVVNDIKLEKTNPNTSGNLESKIKAESNTTDESVTRASAFSNNAERTTNIEMVTDGATSSDISEINKNVENEVKSSEKRANTRLEKYKLMNLNFNNLRSYLEEKDDWWYFNSEYRYINDSNFIQTGNKWVLYIPTFRPLCITGATKEECIINFMTNILIPRKFHDKQETESYTQYLYEINSVEQLIEVFQKFYHFTGLFYDGSQTDNTGKLSLKEDNNFINLYYYEFNDAPILLLSQDKQDTGYNGFIDKYFNEILIFNLAYNIFKSFEKEGLVKINDTQRRWIIKNMSPAYNEYLKQTNVSDQQKPISIRIQLERDACWMGDDKDNPHRSFFEIPTDMSVPDFCHFISNNYITTAQAPYYIISDASDKKNLIGINPISNKFEVLSENFLRDGWPQKMNISYIGKALEKYKTTDLSIDSLYMYLRDKGVEILDREFEPITESDLVQNEKNWVLHAKPKGPRPEGHCKELCIKGASKEECIINFIVYSIIPLKIKNLFDSDCNYKNSYNQKFKYKDFSDLFCDTTNTHNVGKLCLKKSKDSIDLYYYEHDNAPLLLYKDNKAKDRHTFVDDFYDYRSIVKFYYAYNIFKSFEVDGFLKINDEQRKCAIRNLIPVYDRLLTKQKTQTKKIVLLRDPCCMADDVNSPNANNFDIPVHTTVPEFCRFILNNYLSGNLNEYYFIVYEGDSRNNKKKLIKIDPKFYIFEVLSDYIKLKGWPNVMYIEYHQISWECKVEREKTISEDKIPAKPYFPSEIKDHNLLDEFKDKNLSVFYLHAYLRKKGWNILNECETLSFMHLVQFNDKWILHSADESNKQNGIFIESDSQEDCIIQYLVFYLIPIEFKRMRWFTGNYIPYPQHIDSIEQTIDVFQNFYHFTDFFCDDSDTDNAGKLCLKQTNNCIDLYYYKQSDAPSLLYHYTKEGDTFDYNEFIKPYYYDILNIFFIYKIFKSFEDDGFIKLSDEYRNRTVKYLSKLCKAKNIIL